MKLDHFDPPGNIDDFAGDAKAKALWSERMSNDFDVGVASVQQFLDQNGGGTSQFYNPLKHPSAGDLPASTGDVSWNGFPKQHGSTGPGKPARYAEIDSPVARGHERAQDEYLEWYVHSSEGKIQSVQFTCEAWDYFEFLGAATPATRARLLKLYQEWISSDVKESDLFPGGRYDRLNKWNTELGAMHLTNSANNLFAEIFLAASATVRRIAKGAELTAAIPLTHCAGFGDERRNSDPAIGSAVNGLARAGRHITLANPVGLYMASIDTSGLTLDDKPAGGFFKVVRGKFPFALRAVFQIPPEESARGLTVSDVKVGGRPLVFGGQLAELITMHLVAVPSKAQDIQNAPIANCTPVDQVQPAEAVAPGAALVAGSRRPTRASRR